MQRDPANTRKYLLDPRFQAVSAQAGRPAGRHQGMRGGAVRMGRKNGVRASESRELVHRAGTAGTHDVASFKGSRPTVDQSILIVV